MGKQANHKPQKNFAEKHIEHLDTLIHQKKKKILSPSRR